MKVAGCLIVGSILCCAACGGVAESVAPPGGTSLPALEELDAGWSTLRPGGDTICSLGTEYSFFARPADTDRLLIYLQGGGACWMGENCDPDSRPTYSRHVDESDNPAHRPTGIFDLENPANPIADYSMVMIPYCTGDVHIGDRVATYPVEPEGGEPYEVTIRHNGYVNVMSVLDWVFDNFDSPAEIFLAGSSAGSIPAPFYAQIVAEHYADARVVALGDGSGTYRRDADEEQDDPTVTWNTLQVLKQHAGYQDLTQEELGYHDLYVVAGRQHPELRLYQYDSAHDAVQGFYLRLSGVNDPDLSALIKSNRNDIRAQISNFAAYTAGGPEHTILWRPAFYQYEVDGLLFRDWVKALLAGETVEDIDCDRCSRPELHYNEADQQIIERTMELLGDGGAWIGHDEGSCPEASDEDGEAGWSLRCALQQATGEVKGNARAWSAAQLDLRLESAARLADIDPRTSLREYNNHASTRFQDIESLLHTVADRIASHGQH